MMSGFDAIVLAGGRGSRLAGAAKPQLSIGGATMLDRVLTAARGAGTRIVVGPAQPVPEGVVLVQEHPAGSGPVAGLAAGLPRTSSEVVVVLAADLPFLTTEVIEGLLSTLDSDAGVEAALVVDESGRDQNLLGAWRVAPLRAELSAMDPLPGRAMRELIRAMRVVRVEVSASKDAPAPWTDVDTTAELDRARELAQPHIGLSPENGRCDRRQT